MANDVAYCIWEIAQREELNLKYIFKKHVRAQEEINKTVETAIKNNLLQIKLSNTIFHTNEIDSDYITDTEYDLLSSSEKNYVCGSPGKYLYVQSIFHRNMIESILVPLDLKWWITYSEFHISWGHWSLV